MGQSGAGVSLYVRSDVRSDVRSVVRSAVGFHVGSGLHGSVVFVVVIWSLLCWSAVIEVRSAGLFSGWSLGRPGRKVLKVRSSDWVGAAADAGPPAAGVLNGPLVGSVEE